MRLQRACTAKEYVECAVKSQNAVKYHGDNNGNEALILVYFVRRSRHRRIYGIRVWLSAEAEAQAEPEIRQTFSHCRIFLRWAFLNSSRRIHSQPCSLSTCAVCATTRCPLIANTFGIGTRL